jgi:hypothetical protein
MAYTVLTPKDLLPSFVNCSIKLSAAARNKLNWTVEPTLRTLGVYSDDWAAMLLGTAAMESKFRYRAEVQYGGRRGLWKISANRFREIMYRHIPAVAEGKLFTDICQLANNNVPTFPDVTDNDKLGAALCYVQYRLNTPEPPPDCHDVLAQAHYWKRYYAEPDDSRPFQKYLQHWEMYVLYRDSKLNQEQRRKRGRPKLSGMDDSGSADCGIGNSLHSAGNG